MRTAKDIVGLEAGNPILIIGAGGTLNEYSKPILSLVNQCSTIGINSMVDLVVPKYHLWTNLARYREFASQIKSASTLLFGKKLYSHVSKAHRKPNTICIDYVDKERTPVNFHKDRIEGYFRTAGCLAIMIAYLMNATSIHIVGMDGYTFRSQKQLKEGQSQHFYGQGHTDKATWKECQGKDRAVKFILGLLRDYGIRFSILTPTVFDEFYDKSILGAK